MSALEGLLAELAPNGVSFSALGDVGSFTRGRRFTKADRVEQGIPGIHYGEIYTHYGVSASEVVTHVRTDLRPSLRFAQPGEVVVAAVGETVEDVGKAVAWLGNQEVAVHDDCFIFRSDLDPKYVSYFTTSKSFNRSKEPFVARAKVKRLSAGGLAKIRIPVPPIEVQREIVSILDSYTELEAKLEAELEAELQARLRQYRFYHREILADRREESQRVRLDEIADIIVGFPFKSAQFSNHLGDVVLVRGDNIAQGSLKSRDFKRWKRTRNDKLNRYELQLDDVVLAMDRPWIPAGLKWARISDSVLPALLVQRVARLRARSEVLDPGFLRVVVSSGDFTEHILHVQTGNTVPHISSGQIGAFELSLPSLSDQARISATIEAFNNLVDDLSVSLPAELAARRKQYEYYRDRLLSFDEALR